MTYQFLVPPIYSGRLKVGLATTAPGCEPRMHETCTPQKSALTCRFVYQKLERQSAAVDSLFPGPLVGGFAYPIIPVFVSRLDRVSD